MSLRLALLATAALAGCTAASTGPQTVSITSEPQGATCTVARNGTELAAVVTPATVTVDRSEHDLTVTCRKPGWLPGASIIAARYNGIGLRQLVTGGLASVVEDAAHATDFSYDTSPAHVTLQPR